MNPKWRFVQSWPDNRSGRHQPIFEGGEILPLSGESLHFLITSQPPQNIATIHPQKVSQAHDVVEIDSYGVGRGWIQPGHGFPRKEKAFKEKETPYPIVGRIPNLATAGAIDKENRFAVFAKKFVPGQSDKLFVKSLGLRASINPSGKATPTTP